MKLSVYCFCIILLHAVFGQFRHQEEFRKDPELQLHHGIVRRPELRSPGPRGPETTSQPRKFQFQPAKRNSPGPPGIRPFWTVDDPQEREALRVELQKRRREYNQRKAIKRWRSRLTPAQLAQRLRAERRLTPPAWRIPPETE